jgi:hypothetical protein
MGSSINTTMDIDGHLASGSAPMVNRPDDVCELFGSEPVMTASHKESNMSEATNNNRIKIYTADG